MKSMIRVPILTSIKLTKNKNHFFLSSKYMFLKIKNQTYRWSITKYYITFEMNIYRKRRHHITGLFSSRSSMVDYCTLQKCHYILIYSIPIGIIFVCYCWMCFHSQVFTSRDWYDVLWYLNHSCAQQLNVYVFNGT